MPTPTNESKPISNRILTPLWVISIFITLTETVSGIAVSQTTGAIQIVLTGFVVVFPVIIASAFFLLLWNKPHHLYAPLEYGKDVSVQEYINAITQKSDFNASKLYSDIQKSVHSALISDETIAELTDKMSYKPDEPINEDKIKVALNSAAEKAIETIREVGFLTVDSTPLFGNTGKKIQLPYSKYSTIDDLLKDIWLAHSNKLTAFSYGKEWAMREIKTGVTFKDIGMKITPPIRYDRRSLKDVGILPGMKLELVLPYNLNVREI